MSLNDIDENPDDIIIKREYSAKNENHAKIYSVYYSDFMTIILNHPKILDSLICYISEQEGGFTEQDLKETKRKI